MRFVLSILLACGCAGRDVRTDEPPAAPLEEPVLVAAEPEPAAAEPEPADAPEPEPTARENPHEPEWGGERRAVATLRGRASYYHDSLAGNRTASGDIYDPRDFTAASRDLPFGTIVRVRRADTGETVLVRVNDRGPFGRRRRILDLSRAAAEALDMIRAGVVNVRAEILYRP